MATAAFDLAKLRPQMLRAEDDAQRCTVAYARVSSPDQNDDLERQKQVFERYCARQEWTFEVVADLGSGLNRHPPRLGFRLGAGGSCRACPRRC